MSQSAATVSECRTVEVSALNDEGLLEPDSAGLLEWRRNDDLVAALRWERAGPHRDDVDGDQRVIEISYATIDARSGETRRNEGTVPIETTSCNFGGERPWFRCPDCSERVGGLHCPPAGERFRCRECHGLAYESTRATRNPQKRAKLRYERIHEKLHPDFESHHPSLGTFHVTKPNQMHWDTYEELRADLREAHDDWIRAAMARHARMHGRFERLYDRHGSDDASEERKKRREAVEDDLEDGDLWLCPGDAAALDAMDIPH